MHAELALTHQIVRSLRGRKHSCNRLPGRNDNLTFEIGGNITLVRDRRRAKRLFHVVRERDEAGKRGNVVTEGSNLLAGKHLKPLIIHTTVILVVLRGCVRCRLGIVSCATVCRELLRGRRYEWGFEELLESKGRAIEIGCVWWVRRHRCKRRRTHRF